ncbi:deoxynucleoside kinase [Aeromonas caviae]|uniref:Deoxynucleoside kinase n=1 Tax=Aeromonas caviae TaxID=648 RepID=A0AAW9F179_AERCA|nr:deoxynucleoside kinase [Aeromonas caviae]MDX7719402.1 deoxynucleoside kinase [Aeromonas caviae]
MYLCIEGLDGSGKSTLFHKLAHRFIESGYDVAEVCPTKKSRPSSLLERLFARHTFLQRSSMYRAILYAVRSHQAAMDADWSSEVVLGDRSIVTSYVTRWRRWFNCPRLTVGFVDVLERTIPAPDVVLYLQLPAEVLQARLTQRDRPTDIDETAARSEQMRAAYHEIMTDGQIKRLRHTKWIALGLDGDDDPDAVLEKAWAAIMKNTDLLKVS